MSHNNIDLQELFPDLRTDVSPPTPTHIHGIGTALYGARDHHAPTDTYVKTLCFIVLYVPIVALSSYRVIKRRGGWQCLGREPLSSFARFWNLLLFCGLLSAIGTGIYQNHISSPAYRLDLARQSAAAAMADHDLLAAQESMLAMHRIGHIGQVPGKELANQILTALMAEPDHDAFLASYGKLAQARSQASAGTTAELNQHLLTRFLDAPAPQLLAGYQLVTTTLPPPLTGSDPWAGPRLTLLERTYAANPTAVAIASAWAAWLEANDRLDDCAAVLGPLRNELGTSEGARILGQLDAKNGDLEAAYTLLWPYAEQRLARYHELEQQWTKRVETVYNREIKRLERGEAGATWYRRYEAANEAEQMKMVDAWTGGAIERDTHLKSLRDQLERSSTVVGMAFDLGIISLYHGQALEGEARNQALNRAEQAFLTIQGQMGDNQDYQLYLAQVYGWMGKQEACDGILDALTEEQESPTTIAAVGNIYRELGQKQRARQLLERAYEQASGDERCDMASTRAMMFIDLDDQLLWLERDTRTYPAHTAGLAHCRGQIAYRDGNDEEARKQLRLAVNTYDAMPENAVNLNNGSLAARDLFRLTGSIDDLRRSTDMQRSSLRLQPNHSVVAGNTADTLLSEAVLHVVHEDYAYNELRTMPGLNDLNYCASDYAEHQRLAATLASDPDLREAVALMRRLLVLAPSSASTYEQLVGIATTIDDLALLQHIHDQILQADLDLTDTADSARADWLRADTADRLARYQARLDEFQARHASLSPAAQIHNSITIASLQIYLCQLGETTDLEPIIASLNALPPSLARDQALFAAHANRYYQHLCEQQAMPPTLRVLAGIISPGLLCALAVDQAPEPAALLDHPSAVALLNQLQRQRSHRPQTYSPLEWLLCRRSDPARAAACQAHRNQASMRSLLGDINQRLNVWSIDHQLITAIDQLLCDDQAGAKATLAAARQRGMPLGGLHPALD